MRNTTKTAGVLLCGTLALLTLSGCGKSKQEAAVSLDEARLNISSARKVGADVHAYWTLKEAQSALNDAEQSFKKGSYAAAGKEALKASEAAQRAKSETEGKLSERKPSKPAERRPSKPAKKAAKRK